METAEGEIKRLALAEPRIEQLLAGKEVVKVVVVPGRLVSVVVKG